MNSHDEQYILENAGKKSSKAIARDLGIKEKKISKFLKKHRSEQPARQAPGRPSKKFYPLAVLGAIVVLALIVRLYPVIYDPESRRYGLGQFGDTDLYQSIAYNVYTGHGFSGTDTGGSYGKARAGKDLIYEPEATRAPGYPLFMYGVYKIFGSAKDMISLESWRNHWDKVRVTQCILDSLICIMVFIMARTIYSRSSWPAVFGALIYCFSFYNIYYTKALLTESLSAFLVTLAITLYVTGLKQRRIYLWCLSGFAFGIVVLTRPEYVLFLPLMACFIPAALRRPIRPAIAAAAVFLACAVFAITPWVVRNYMVFKKPMIMASVAGYNLYLGTFESPETYRYWGVFPDEIFHDEREKADVIKMYEARESRIKTGSIEAEKYDDFFKKLAIKRIVEDPFGCLGNWVRKIPRLWYQNYIRIYGEKEASGMFFLAYFSFSIFAFVNCRRAELMLMMPVTLLFIYLTVIYMPLHVEPRYSVPAMPGIICLAGIGLWRALEWTGVIKGA